MFVPRLFRSQNLRSFEITIQAKVYELRMHVLCASCHTIIGILGTPSDIQKISSTHCCTKDLNEANGRLGRKLFDIILLSIRRQSMDHGQSEQGGASFLGKYYHTLPYGTATTIATSLHHKRMLSCHLYLDCGN
eukprot:scaffold10591_cov112-Amphora_coffeaeformis.AAC.3